MTYTTDGLKLWNYRIRSGGLKDLPPVTAKASKLSWREHISHFTARKKKEINTMATSPVTPEPTTGKFKTFLQHTGSVLRKILHIGEEAAAVATPLVEAYFPEVAPLFISGIGLAQAAEATASATTGTGAQKLAQVVIGLNPLIDKFVANNKLGDWDAAGRAKFASAIADALNLIPAPKAS